MRRLSESRLAFLAPLLRPIHQRLPPVNFITIHYAYFIATCLLAAIIFWGSSTPARSVSFTDSLFLAVSAMTLAGLNTVNLSTLNTFQQFILFILIMMGSAIFVSAFTVHVRRKAFERKFASIVRDRKDRLGNHGLSLQTLPFTRSFSRSRTMERSSTEAPSRRSLRHVSSNRQDGIKVQPTDARDSPERPMDSKGELSSAHDQSGESAIDDVVEASPTRAITFSANTHFRRPSDDHEGPRRRRRMSMLSMSGVGAVSGSGFDNISLHRSQTGRSNEDNASMHSHQQATHHYFPSSGFISRNSQFHGLTEEERERLGGVEYGAIHWLSWLVPIYFVLWQLIACIGCAAYVAINRPSTARTNGLDPWWVGAFNAVSAFNNSGMSLLDANMTAYQTSYYMLITMSLLILAGNTCYPIFLRLIIWVIMKLMPDDETWKEQRSTLRFLLDHPRRCYTNLFPSQHTWWLLFAVISLNAVDWAAFEILNIGNTKLTSGLPTNIRVIDGLFQAFAVRSGGFYVVSIPSLRISLQVLYVVMMYVSVYPVVITMRNSNVYEERSLGIYSDDPNFEDYENQQRQERQSFWRGPMGLKRSLTQKPDERSIFVRQQLRAQLAHDSWWICLAVFLIMIIESSQFERDPAVFSVFNVIFEVVSAYGTVGISVGVPWADYSFCGAWHTLSKLILCAVMLRGRHRGLPVAIDKAVLLPGEKLGHAEEEDAMIRQERSGARKRPPEGTV